MVTSRHQKLAGPEYVTDAALAVNLQDFFFGALVRTSLWEFDGTAYARTMKSQKTSGSSGFLTNMCSAHGEGVCVPSCFRFSATAIRLCRQISAKFSRAIKRLLARAVTGCCDILWRSSARLLQQKVHSKTRSQTEGMVSV